MEPEKFSEKIAKPARAKDLPEEGAPDAVRRSRRFTEKEIERNMRDVAEAVAQQELEGLTVPKETVADLERVARGEMDTDEARRNIKRRAANEQILRR